MSAGVFTEDNISVVESNEIAPSKKPADLAHGADFTFRAPNPAIQGVDVSISISCATTRDEERNMKRPKGHPDGPTPANSPQKKRV
jgi:hypothetical protein